MTTIRPSFGAFNRTRALAGAALLGATLVGVPSKAQQVPAAPAASASSASAPEKRLPKTVTPFCTALSTECKVNAHGLERLYILLNGGGKPQR